MASFDVLIANAEVEPTAGWDFSWFEGRATEERPSWGYARLMAARLAEATSALDVQTGGGEVLAEAQRFPRRLVATESWLPNVELASRRLQHRGVSVVAVDDDALPFADVSFDLVTSRHPVVTAWDEIARVLVPGGTYLSQQVGPASNRELGDFLVGEREVGQGHDPRRHVQRAEMAGLEVIDLREETLEVRFYDIGAVVYFLRKVVWTIPDFTVERYLAPLRKMHQQIEHDGAFVSHSRRFLIETRRPRQ